VNKVVIHLFFAAGLLIGNAIFSPVAKTLSERLVVGSIAAVLYLAATGVVYYFGWLR